MKRIKQLFILLAITATITAHSITKGTPKESKESTSMSEMDDSNNMDNMGSMGMDMTEDEYWNQVKGKPFKFTGETRTYYIGADEVKWDYAPDGINKITGEPFDEAAQVFVQRGPERIGSKYLKCLYREYTSSKFKKLKPRPAEEEYLGFLGPVIRAEVGDRIRIVFRNGCRIPTSVHPHGVFYDKDDEGAPYNDGTSGKDKEDDAVQPGDKYTYIWKVPERAGPAMGDGSSIMWMYHSHTNENTDFYAGLVGPMAITRKGKAFADGSPRDVCRELFFMFSISNENASPYLAVNYAKYAEEPKRPEVPEGDEEFEESNLMHNINGFVFGNGPMITMKKNERVRWYVMSMGSELDLHTPHWHGNDAVVDMMRMDVMSLLPAEMATADMVPDNEGIWLFHCHVGDHLDGGMVTRYEVKDDCMM